MPSKWTFQIEQLVVTNRNSLGGLTQADIVIQRIMLADDVFWTASTSNFNHLKEVEPEYSYTMIVKNADDKNTRLEISLSNLYAETYSASSITCFEHVEDKKRLDITSMFLEK